MMPKHALIVDDSQLAQYVLKKMLKEEDIDAECSASAEEALDYLKSNKPDVIFLDHTMPGMNGLELLKLLKNDAVTQEIPVMMYTSQEDQRYTEKAIDLGAIEVLPKQLKRPDLHRVLITLDDGQQDVKPILYQEDNNELEQVIYDAEEALKHETWQQRFKQAFEEHRETSSEQIQQLNERLDRLMLHQDQLPHKRQMFWNNIFWMLLFCIALGVFAFIYTQQQQELNVFKNGINSTPTAITPTQSIGSTTETSITEDQNVIASDINNDLEELQDYFNINRIPFSEVLLGSSVLEVLEEVNTILSNENFKGVIVITPLESTFCIARDELGEPTLLGGEALVSQCEFTVVNTELSENISVEVQQFINTQNANNDEYQYIIAGIENNRANLPEITETTSATAWNNAAANNRRIQFEFQPTL